MRAAHVALDRDVLLVAGIAPQQTYDRVEPAFIRSINSFRPLTRVEAEAIRPNRVLLYTARAGDSWQSIAEREGKGVVKATTLAIMNGHAIDDQPRRIVSPVSPGDRAFRLLLRGGGLAVLAITGLIALFLVLRSGSALKKAVCRSMKFST